MTVQRTIPANVQTEMVKQQTRPFFIVKIEFESATSYLSEAQAVTFESNAYLEGAIKVRSFTWTPNGTQEGSIALLNENDAATALVLNNVIQDVPISIYKVYSTGPSTNTDPVLLIKGVMNGSDIRPAYSVLGVLTSTAETEFAPRSFYTIEEGFNWLPPVGTVVQWNGEKYVLEGIELA